LARVEEMQRVQRLQRRLSKLDITIKRHVRDEDKMYGSVTAKNIADKLTKSELKVSEKDVLLEEAIKVVAAACHALLTCMLPWCRSRTWFRDELAFPPSVLCALVTQPHVCRN
jgi:hypothetical protein